MHAFVSLLGNPYSCKKKQRWRIFSPNSDGNPYGGFSILGRPERRARAGPGRASLVREKEEREKEGEPWLGQRSFFRIMLLMRES